MCVSRTARVNKFLCVCAFMRVLMRACVLMCVCFVQSCFKFQLFVEVLIVEKYKQSRFYLGC